jgi:DNA repair exonuclease SbcCD ATPase subunit
VHLNLGASCGKIGQNLIGRCPMKKTREQVKQELTNKSVDVIEKLLDWNEANKAPDLAQIEAIILELRAEMGLEFAASLLLSQETAAPVVEKCKTCGKEMRNKGQKKKVIESQIGGIVMERDYYYCGECGAGIFPPGSTAKGKRRTK